MHCAPMWIAWVIFIGFVLAMLALDLGAFHRKSHVVGVREALGWSALWISLGLLFSGVVYFAYDGHWFGLGLARDSVDGVINNGSQAAIKYLTGYVVEKSLSVDNIFVIAIVFGSMAVPAMYQHRVLFWGILGALLMRGAMIGVGTALVTRFHWILYLFGAFLVFTGVKMLFVKAKEEHPENNPVVRALKRRLHITRDYHGKHFLVKPGAVSPDDPVLAKARSGAWIFTPLAIALMLVEVTDVIFAVDSIPAIFAITADPFLVFTSNVFAILGLRSLYFALAGVIAKFRYLKPALSLILMVVGVKMLAAHWLKDVLGEAFNFVVLGVILALLVAGVVTSLVLVKEDKDATSGVDGGS